MDDLVFDHITVIDPRDNVVNNGERALYADNINSYRPQITNSIIPLNEYGFSSTCGGGSLAFNFMTGGGVPTPCTAALAPSWIVTSNVFPKIGDHNTNSYPSNNFYPENYSGVGLANYVRCDSNTESCDQPITNFECVGSVCNNAGSDGLDIGANIPLLAQRIACSESGIGTNCSTQPPTTQTPFPQVNPPNIPLTLEVENYDNGGEGIAYHDDDTGNSGGVYRFDDVDIRARTNASNGFEVFKASAGEWLEYTVNVPFTRKYDIGIRYASEFNNGKFRIQDCGSDPNNQNCSSPVELTGQLTVTSTGNWSNFRVITKRGVTLPAGIHVLRLKVDSNATDGCACVVADFDAILFNTTLFDYDNDGRADVSVWRPADGNWYLNRSKDGFTAVNFGLSGDIIVPADFDGDGLSDISVFRPSNGVWHRLNSSNGQYISVQFGQSGDIPVQADYDGDGKADISVWRPSDGVWYRLNSSNGNFVTYQFGSSGDKPAVGDYDGDGKADFAVFRPSNGVWYIQRSLAGLLITTFGLGTDLITPADYDGDGKTDISVFRPSNGGWYRVNSTNGQIISLLFGSNGDIPVPADYDGDGKVDVAVFRPSNSIWYLWRSTEGYAENLFGSNGDVPIPSAFVR